MKLARSRMQWFTEVFVVQPKYTNISVHTTEVEPLPELVHDSTADGPFLGVDLPCGESCQLTKLQADNETTSTRTNVCIAKPVTGTEKGPIVCRHSN